MFVNKFEEIIQILDIINVIQIKPGDYLIVLYKQDINEKEIKIIKVFEIFHKNLIQQLK